jgi:hypothetical protein
MIRIFTGGDDNAITRLDLTMRDGNVEETLFASIESAHCSNVTGNAINVLIIGAQLISDEYVVSVSIDQRLKIWNSDLKGDCLQEEYLDIADISDSTFCATSGSLVVGGAGLQRLEINVR